MGIRGFFLLFTLVCSNAFAGGGLPDCVDRARRPMDSNNEEVLDWKESSPNQFKSRALILGSLVGVILDRKSHLHLEVDLLPANGPDQRSEHIEIVYNKEFGLVDHLQPGVAVAACGDYITAREKAGNYQPSPLGAIIHWVHRTNNPEKHPSGFLSIDGVLYGMGEGIVTLWESLTLLH